MSVFLALLVACFNRLLEKKRSCQSAYSTAYSRKRKVCWQSCHVCVFQEACSSNDKEKDMKNKSNWTTSSIAPLNSFYLYKKYILYIYIYIHIHVCMYIYISIRTFKIPATQKNALSCASTPGEKKKEKDVILQDMFLGGFGNDLIHRRLASVQKTTAWVEPEKYTPERKRRNIYICRPPIFAGVPCRIFGGW